MPGITNVGAEGKNKRPRKNPKKKVQKSAEEKRLLAHKEMTKDKAYMAPKAYAKKVAEKKRLKAHKEMTKDEAYSDPTPGVGRHPPSASGKPVRRKTSKPTVKDSKGNPIKGGGGNVTWSGGLSAADQKKRRESRRRGGRTGYSGGGIALRGFGSTLKK